MVTMHLLVITVCQTFASNPLASHSVKEQHLDLSVVS